MAGIQKTVRKGLAYLKKRGIRKTIRKTALHIDRKRLERRYVRQMMPGAEELAAQRAERFENPVRFSVVVPLYNTPMELLREMIDSVRGQSYPEWELCLADGSDESHGEVEVYCREAAAAEGRIRYRKLEKNEGISGNSNAALEMAGGDYIALFDHDDLLRADALYEMAKAIRETGADFLYSDEMIFQSPKTSHILGIRFKPDFTPEDLWTNNYICHLTVFRRELLKEAGGFRKEFDGSQDHDLVLRLTGAAKKIAHVPKVLYFWRSIPGSVAADVHMKEYAIEAGRKAVETWLRNRGEKEARVESTEVFPTMYRVRFPEDRSETVRVIVDMPSGGERLLADIQGSSDWPAVGWTVTDPREKSRMRRYARAAAESKADYLVFMDGLLEPRNQDWVWQMLQWARRKEIGAVGARVRFAESTDLRHAGVILGLGAEGLAGRAYFDMEDDLVGFFGQLAVVRNVSAVTDCWMIERRKFEEIGGFDPGYGDALFDVDLCMRLRERGYRNLWTPDACLSGGKAVDFAVDVGRERAAYPGDSALFRKKWEKELRSGDPCYNPNLSLLHEDWRIKGKKELDGSRVLR